MDFVDVFAVLLLLAIGAGMFVSWDRRSETQRRASSRGDRRDAHQPQADGTEPT